ncbi:hypothetical protein [uncultured Piscinibacter sp.]|uniref:hypothetical protein n=1 Tax=uncultured Piscinibacter sp. TaxID=1131835 RepID=UPI00261662C6|nr:hypothetical protein [uncultured Piscinibacter sp.]
MPIPAATLQEAALRRLIQAGAVTDLVVRGQVGGFVIETVIGLDGTRVAVLGNTRKGSRVFASVTTVAMLLRRLGIDRFTVEAAHYVPGRTRSARPDRAAAMRSVVLSNDGAKAKSDKN